MSQYVSVCCPLFDSKPAMIRDLVLDDLTSTGRVTAALGWDFLEGILSGECNLSTNKEDFDLLVKLLDMDDYPELQCGALLALTGFARSTSENVSAIIRAGAVPFFVKLLVSEMNVVRCQAILALSSIPCDSLERLELVLRSGALTPSHKAWHGTLLDHDVLPDIFDALRSFFGGCSLDRTKAALPALKDVVVSSTDVEVRANAFWALAYHTTTNEQVQAIIDEGFCPILVEHFNSGPSSVSYAALRVVGRIVDVDDAAQIQAVLEHGALPRIKELLTHTNDLYVEGEACFCLSKIAQGTEEQIGAVFEAGLISSLINLAKHKPLIVRMFALEAIAHATYSSPEKISRLVSEGGIGPLCDFLLWSGGTNVRKCLDGLENIFEAGELRKTMSCSGVNEFADEIRRKGGIETISGVADSGVIYDLDYDVKGHAAKILEKFGVRRKCPLEVEMNV